MIRRRNFLQAALAGSAALLSSCSPLRVLNAWVPSGTYRASSDIAFGEHPREKLDVYVPANPTSAMPVVVFFYGGNWNAGHRSDYVFVGEALASRGIVAVIPDYRLYPDVRWPAFLDDCARAVRWTYDHVGEYGGSPERVFLMGHSAGAYNAAMLALDPQYLRNAGVDVRRVRGLIGLAGPYDFLPLTNAVAKLVFGFPDTPLETQPIRFVTPAAPPALLITAASDKTVNPGNSVRLAARLKANSVIAREIVYPRVGHATLVAALASPLRSLAPVADDVAAFVHR